MEEKIRKPFGLSIALLSGALVGAGLGMLLTPTSGSDTRRRIKRYGLKGYAAGKSRFEKAIRKVRGRNEKVAEAVGV